VKGEASRGVWRAEARLRPGHGRPWQLTLQLAPRALQQEQGGQGQELPRGGRGEGGRWRAMAVSSADDEQEGTEAGPATRAKQQVASCLVVPKEHLSACCLNLEC